MSTTGKSPRTGKTRGAIKSPPTSADAVPPDPEMRRVLHMLIDRLRPADESTARRVLEALAAGPDGEGDEEPMTLDEQAASEHGWQEYLRGEARPLDEVLRDLAKQ